MALVTFTTPGERPQTKTMKIPKKVTSIIHWLKEARKAIPDIPDVYGDLQGTWRLKTLEVEVEYIIWYLECPLRPNETAVVKVNRKASALRM